MSFVESHQTESIIELRPSFSFPAHLHLHLEAVYLLAGEQSMQIDGQEYNLRAGDLAVIFPGLLHEFTSGSDDCRLLLMIYAPQISGVKGAEESLPVSPVLEKADRIPEMRFCLQSIEKRMSGPSPALHAFLGLMTALFLEKTALSPRSNAPREMIYQAVSYLADHFDEPLTLEMVAEKLNISPYHLSHLFSRRLHISFKPYLNSLRIARARQLLSDPSRSITQVCYECGFETLRTFDRVFQQHCGCTPREYRR